MKNTKGLSTVVTSLIIILLVLVAIGIIWVVVKGVLESSGSQIGLTTKCTTNMISIESASCTSATNCTITIRRTGGTAVNGTRVVFSNDIGTGTELPITGDPGVLKTTSSLNPGTPGTSLPTKVTAVAYFNDEDNQPQTCPNPVDKVI